jgi:hypothetical protein
VRLAEKCFGGDRAGVEKVLAVVEDEQQPLCCHVVDQPRHRPSVDSSRSPSEVMTALGTSSASTRLASSTSQMPSGKARWRSVATRTARRVLPTPPDPTRLSRRPADSPDLTSWTCAVCR